MLTKFLLCCGFAALTCLAFSQTPVTGLVAPLQRSMATTPAPGHIFMTQNPLDSLSPYPNALLLVDSAGKPVYFQHQVSRNAPPYRRRGISDFKLQPSGYFSYSAQWADGSLGMYLLNQAFEIVDSIQCTNGFPTDGHDLIHTKEGDFILLGYDYRSADLSAMATATGGFGVNEGTVYGNVIQRFDSTKKLLFEWKSLDHFALNDAYSHFFTDSSILDHSHYNSIEIDTDGHYLVSFRHLHEITKINSQTGDIIWHFGGKNNDFELVGDTMLFSAQHDARRIANGNLTLLDNGQYNAIPVARSLEYELDEKNMVATLVWEHREPLGRMSRFIGNSSRLIGGNTFINWGGVFPLSQGWLFTEVNAKKEVMMNLDFAFDGIVSYRAIKQSIPFSLNRPEITCEDGKLMAPEGYSYYEWNTGDTGQTLTVTDTGNYQVWVNRGAGYLASEAVYISQVNAICQQVGVNPPEPRTVQWRAYPNPATSEVKLSLSVPSVDVVSLYGLTGVQIKSWRHVHDGAALNVDEIPRGMYVLHVADSQELLRIE